jgi:hypothetical protein
MTRVELRARVAAVGFPVATVRGRTIRGPGAWCAAIRKLPTLDLQRAIESLRRQGIDLTKIRVSPCAFPSESPRPSAPPAPAPPRMRQAPVVRSAGHDALEHPLPTMFDGVPNTAPQLVACRLATPLVAQERIVDDAIRDARAAGLQLPLFAIEWRDGRPDICAGAVERTTSGRYTVFLSVNAWPNDLRRTACHELRHLADFELGLFEQLTRAELEQRATMFAERMCR